MNLMAWMFVFLLIPSSWVWAKGSDCGDQQTHAQVTLGAVIEGQVRWSKTEVPCENINGSSHYSFSDDEVRLQMRVRKGTHTLAAWIQDKPLSHQIQNFEKSFNSDLIEVNDSAVVGVSQDFYRSVDGKGIRFCKKSDALQDPACLVLIQNRDRKGQKSYTALLVVEDSRRGLTQKGITGLPEGALLEVLRQFSDLSFDVAALQQKAYQVMGNQKNTELFIWPSLTQRNLKFLESISSSSEVGSPVLDGVLFRPISGRSQTSGVRERSSAQ